MKSLLNILLVPLSWLYGLCVWIRNLLYDENILASYTVSVPTICVGNLAAGGTGKTPMVEYLIRLLAPTYKVAVLSRGYGRKTKGFVMANDESTAATIGDEMFQLHSKFPEVPVAVCADRLKGIKRLEREIKGLQAVILDDAFQHRRLECGFNILLTAYDNLYVNDHLLPWGRLREQKHGSNRANAVVVTKCPHTMQPIDRRVISNALHLPVFQLLYFSHINYQAINIEGKPLVITGIAHPEYMLRHVRKQYPLAGHIAFPDHHMFSDSDVNMIMAEMDKYDFLLTTEKDMARMRLTALPELLGGRLVGLPIEVSVETTHDSLDRQIKAYIYETLHHEEVNKSNIHK